MKTMYTCMGALLCLCCTCLPAAQAQTTAREVGLYAFGLNSFSAAYKKQLSENKWFRMRIANSAFQFGKQEHSKPLQLGASVGLGVETRKTLSNKMLWYRGWELTPGFNFQQNGINKNYKARLGLHYVLGLQYELNKSFYINAELVPGIYGNYEYSNATKLHLWNVGWSLNNAASLGLFYRWGGA